MEFGVPQEGHRFGDWHQVARQLQPLGRHLDYKERDARPIATRTIEAGDQAALHDIDATLEDNRDFPRGPYSGPGCRSIAALLM